MNPDADPPSRNAIVFRRFDLKDESRREAVFALGNGVLGVRGAAPDARTGDQRYPGTYRAGLYNPTGVEVDGEIVRVESLVKLPNCLMLDVRLDDAADPFRLETAAIEDYSHRFVFDAATTHRSFTIRHGEGRRTRVAETRFVSMDEPDLVALRLTLTPENWHGTVTISSGIDAEVRNELVRTFRAYGGRHLAVERVAEAPGGLLSVGGRTEPGGIPLALTVRHRASRPMGAREVARGAAAITETFGLAVEPGVELAIEKLAAVEAGRAEPRGPGILASAAPFVDLQRQHERRWADLWRRVCFAAEAVALDGAIRFHFLHLLQATSLHSVGLDTGFPARGWEEGYHGQIFWDELFVFPVFNLRFPELSRAMLLYRWRRLDAARDLAREGGCRGAMYPWRSAGSGREETPRLELNPTSGRWLRDDTNRQRHIGAAVAHDIWSYYVATGDEAFLRDHGAEMLVEIARFWASIAKWDEGTERFSISGVVGPDEYHTLDPRSGMPGLTDNAYTNLMAAWTLLRARDALEALRPTDRKAVETRLALTPDELAHWDRVSRRLRIAFHGDGIISQCDGFELLRPFDLDRYRAVHGHDRVDWTLEKQGENVAEVQVAKQADLLMLLYLLPLDEVEALLERLGYRVTRAQLLATATYYLQRTSHDSSLSRVAAAGALTKLDPALSWRFYEETLRPELVPANRSSGSEGVHLGAMAGTIDVLQRCYLGLHVTIEGIRLAPAIPMALGGVTMGFRCRHGRFELRWTGECLVLSADPENSEACPVWRAADARRLAPGRQAEFRLDRDAASGTFL